MEQRRAHRVLGMISADRVAAFKVLVEVHRITEIGQLGRHLARVTGMNAVVLDGRDYMGPVNYPSKAKIAVEIGSAAKPWMPDLARAIRFAHWRGVRIIMRIPCFHDPWAARRAPRISLKSAATGLAGTFEWLDPTNEEAQNYALELVQEQLDAGARGEGEGGSEAVAVERGAVRVRGGAESHGPYPVAAGAIRKPRVLLCVDLAGHGRVHPGSATMG